MSLITLGILLSGTQLTAILRKNEEVYENTRLLGLKHNSVLLGLIDSLLTESGTDPSEIGLVACTRGPGSFTALRIVMATAKGLCAPREIPLKSVPTLDLWGSFYAHFTGAVAPIIDGRKNRYYTRFYEGGRAVSEHLDLSYEEILHRSGEYADLLFCGPDQDAFSSSGIPGALTSGNTELPGTWLLKRAREIFEREGPDSRDIGPLYCRKSDAELGRT
jgi:tRNA threonylcarbamoyladenosine biosynthesis protein TsaB